MPSFELVQLVVSQVAEGGGNVSSGGGASELLQYGNLGINGFYALVLWKLWGLYREQQVAMAAIMNRLVDHVTGTKSKEEDK